MGKNIRKNIEKNHNPDEIPNIEVRSRETALLQRILDSKKSELVAVYGRRRIGKTHLIRNFFSEKGLFFEVIGQKDGSVQDELEIFTTAFSKLFYNNLKLEPFASWSEALDKLSTEIKKNKTSKIILFFDELPWLASPKSNLLQALDHIWNSEWSQNPRIKLILCGSAASWMLEKLIYAKGGLHNRITYRVALKPFTLEQAHRFLLGKQLRYSQKQTLEAYMTFGGVAFYLNAFQKGWLAAQNTNELLFATGALLGDEFDKLFASLFDKSEIHKKIFTHIAGKRYGISRANLLKKLKMPSGGQFNKFLKEIEEAGFVSSFTPFNQGVKSLSYRVIDEFSLFYQFWLKDNQKGVFASAQNDFWLKNINTPRWHTWTGLTFELLCYKHIPEIGEAIGLKNISFKASFWNQDRVQIDLIFDRDDGVVQLFEIKYCDREFEIDAAIAQQIKTKIERFKEATKTKKSILFSFISPYGIKQNYYAGKCVDSEVVLKDFFGSQHNL